MKKLQFVALLGVMSSGPLLAVDLWTEDFETDGNGSRYTASTEFNDGNNDHWGRTDGSNISNVSGAYSGFSNSYFWAGEDLDDNGGNGSASQTIEISNINISGYQNISFSGLFAAGNANAPGANAYDSTDGIVIQYRVDGGGYVNGMCFSYENHGDNYNEPLALDSDCQNYADATDGTGRLNTQLQSFGFAIPNGSSVDLLITATFNGAKEEFAVDQLQISGDLVATDNPPAVSATTPSNAAVDVAVDSDVSIIFSENIDATAGAVTMVCGGDNVSFSGLPASNVSQLTLNPSSDFAQGVTCQVTVVASQVTDLDGTPNNMSSDYQFSFTTVQPIPVVEIFEIQGSALASPYVGSTVTTNNNIVTALDTNGFFMQTPDSRDDGNVNTSNGIFVYTGSSPSVQVAEGDDVSVTGEVAEFYDSTQIGFGSSITINSSGNALPTAITFDNTFPPTDPQTAICSTDLETAKFECMEGMLMSIPQGFISSAFAAYSGANAADLLVKAGSDRAFREQGIEYPGGGGSIPTFDGNPELMQVDIDGLTLPLATYTAGSEISIQGILGYDFGEYEIWPKTLTVINENVLPNAVANAGNDEITLSSLNLYNLYNDVDDSDSEFEDIPSTQEYQDHLAKLSHYIINTLQAPMILAVQEVENINTLNALVSKINTDSGIVYQASLIEGNDRGGKDVAFIYRDNVTITEIVQHGKDAIFSFDNSLLHDRPPLQLSAQVTAANGLTVELNLLAVHLRSRSNIDDATDGERVRQKRLAQANAVADMISTIQGNNPNEAVLVLGDFNAFQFTDGYVDVSGQIAGTAVEAENTLWSAPLFAASPLTQAVQYLTANRQYSYIYGGSAQVLDNAMLNDEGLIMFQNIQFGRGNADAHVDYGTDVTSTGIGLRASDHDGLVLYLSTIPTDIIFKHGFED